MAKNKASDPRAGPAWYKRVSSETGDDFGSNRELLTTAGTITAGTITDDRRYDDRRYDDRR